jgi:hypothetical protein
MPAFAWCALGLGCGGGHSGLDRSVVTSLPDGDATGSAASGNFNLDLYTRSCSGDCTYSVGGATTISVCDVGQRMSATVILTQTDGHLQVDGDSSLIVDRLVGGIYKDGRFSVGGYATQLGGAVQVTARVDGTLAGDSLTATAQALGVGSVSGDSIDCLAGFDVTGHR